MVIFDQIVNHAKEQKKNILVIGSARSGTHAVGGELAKIGQAKYLGEICRVSDKPEPWNEIQLLYDTDQLTVGQVVQLTPKIHLSHDVNSIKNHNVIVNVCRKNKVKQFASWVYFRLMDPTECRSWHNHTAEKTNVVQNSVKAQENDLIQFILEQMVNDYFLPDFSLCYEDLTFTQTDYKKNEFNIPLETMFSNLEYVEKYLKDWQYSPKHFIQ
jgi:hypothetical protein